MNINDIEGTSTRKQQKRKQVHDQEYRDVCTKTEKKRADPHNPCEPKYKTRDENNNLIEIGHVKGSKATKPYYRKNHEDNKANTVKGIEYATTGTKSKGNFKNRERRQVRQTNNVNDIPGSSTLVKSATMKRMPLDPLKPDYQLPGQKVNASTDGGNLGFVASAKINTHRGLRIVKSITENATTYHSTGGGMNSSVQDDLKSAGKHSSSYIGKIPTISHSARLENNRDSQILSQSQYSGHSSVFSGIRPPTKLALPKEKWDGNRTNQVMSNTKSKLGLDK